MAQGKGEQVLGTEGAWAGGLVGFPALSPPLLQCPYPWQMRTSQTHESRLRSRVVEQFYNGQGVRLWRYLYPLMGSSPASMALPTYLPTYLLVLTVGIALGPARIGRGGTTSPAE